SLTLPVCFPHLYTYSSAMSVFLSSSLSRSYSACSSLIPPCLYLHDCFSLPSLTVHHPLSLSRSSIQFSPGAILPLFLTCVCVCVCVVCVCVCVCVCVFATQDYTLPHIDLFPELEGCGLHTSYHCETEHVSAYGIPKRTPHINDTSV